MSALASYLQQERERRGWTIVEFAERADMPDSTLSRIMNDEIAEPKGSQIARIAKALDIPFWRLMQIAGFTTETPDSPDEEQRRIALLLAADPTLRPILDKVANLNRANRQAILVAIELLQRQQNGLPPHPES